MIDFRTWRTPSYIRQKLEFYSLDLAERQAVVEAMSNDMYAYLRYWTDFFVRENQMFPLDFEGDVYFLCGGRGLGKTYAGSYAIAERLKYTEDELAIVVPTYKDLLDVNIPAIIQHFSPNDRPLYTENSKRMTYKGKVLSCFTSEKEVRGGNYAFTWADELPRWCDGLPDKITATYDALDFAIRKARAQVMVTSTPLKCKLMERWFEQEKNNDPSIRIVRGTMADNDHLSSRKVQNLIERFSGSAKGRQELYGEIIEHNPDALWTPQLIGNTRIPPQNHTSTYTRRTVIAVDPAGSNSNASDLTGIVIASIDLDSHIYVIADLSGKYSPNEWATKIAEAMVIYECDCIVAERNYGGQLVEANIRTTNPFARIKLVNARKAKLLRAEPIAALFEQGRAHLVGSFPELERQMTTYTGDPKQKSPDRLDAMVYAITELVFGSSQVQRDFSGVGWF